MNWESLEEQYRVPASGDGRNSKDQQEKEFACRNEVVFVRDFPVKWPNTGGAAAAPCSQVPNESDLYETATVENLHTCICPLQIPAAAVLRHFRSSCPWISGFPSF